jgi:Fur family transcriptional regulator, iron response regulator
LRPTCQRVELGCILFGKGHRHITAEDLHAEADVAGVRVSLATVYKTLHQFTESGLLRAVAIDGSPTYFDTNASDHHHFFVEGEGQLIDLVGDVGIQRLPEPPEGMEVTAIELVVRVRYRRRRFTDRCRRGRDADGLGRVGRRLAMSAWVNFEAVV